MIFVNIILCGFGLLWIVACVIRIWTWFNGLRYASHPWMEPDEEYVQEVERKYRQAKSEQDFIDAQNLSLSERCFELKNRMIKQYVESGRTLDNEDDILSYQAQVLLVLCGEKLKDQEE